ncbi:uncharacterized protein [Typha latifolia]|uniref:uncharacterized protein n=1 Tax=Typha latifolia TaxID=4733 RepID=UPI003C2DECA1
MGAYVPLPRLKAMLAKLWNGIDGFAVSDMAEGFYVFRFDKEEYMMYVLTNGPWTLGGMVLNLIKWRDNFRPSPEAFTTAPVWIQLHDLPQEYWELESLIPVAAYFGKPLHVNETTLDHSRSRFVRVCVEVDLGQPLKQVVSLGPREHNLEQKVVYEGVLTICFKCGRLGHDKATCTAHQPEPKTKDEARQKDQHSAAANRRPGDGKENMANMDSSVFGPWMKVTRKPKQGYMKSRFARQGG